MIKADQPTIFGKDLTVAVSSIDDGNIKFGGGLAEHVTRNRRNLLRKIGITLDRTTLVSIAYDTDNFAKYRVVTAADKGAGMVDGMSVEHADALVVDGSNHALFLPIAD